MKGFIFSLFILFFLFFFFLLLATLLLLFQRCVWNVTGDLADLPLLHSPKKNI